MGDSCLIEVFFLTNFHPLLTNPKGLFANSTENLEVGKMKQASDIFANDLTELQINSI